MEQPELVMKFLTALGAPLILGRHVAKSCILEGISLQGAKCSKS